MAPCAQTEDGNYSHIATVLGSAPSYRGGREVGMEQRQHGHRIKCQHRPRHPAQRPSERDVLGLIIN